MFWCPFARCPASREDRRHVHEYLIFRYQSIVGQIDDVRAGQHDLAAVVPDVGYSQLGDQGAIHLPGAQYLVADAGKGALKPMDRVTRAVPADNGLVVAADEHSLGSHPGSYGVRVEPIYERKERLGPGMRVGHDLPPVCGVTRRPADARSPPAAPPMRTSRLSGRSVARRMPQPF